MGAAQPGRNDRCPCGSGKKYKQCCLRAEEADLSTWHQLRHAEGRLVNTLFPMALDLWGKKGFEDAQRRFYDGVGAPEYANEDREFESLFTTWYAYTYTPKPRRGKRPELSAAQQLLANATDLSDIERRFLTEAVAEPTSFQLITAVTPASSIDIEDLLTGTTRHVLERTASQTVKRGGIVFGRAITVNGVSVLSGMGTALLPPSWRIEIGRMREAFEEAAGTLTRERVLLLDDVLRRYYLSVADQIFNPPLPTLSNTDGDPFSPTTLHYTLHCSPEDALLALRSLNLHVDDDDAIENRVDRRGQLRAFSIEWTKAGNTVHKNWDNTILGHIEVDGSALTANVNSNRRATRLRKQLEKRLGSFAALQQIVTEPVEAMMEKARATRGITAAAEPEDVDPETTAAFLDQQWDEWLDSPIPALDNRTPREAVKTGEGRLRVEALLDEFEWTGGAQAAPVERLRAALALSVRGER